MFSLVWRLEVQKKNIMGRKNRKSRSSASTVSTISLPSHFSSVSSQRTNTTSNASSTKKRRRRKRAARVSSRSEDSEWFVMYSRQICSLSPGQGVLFQSILHPMLFPNTPYFARCQNFTHRIERFWEFEIMITAAVTTGVRIAAVPVDDPSPQPAMNPIVAYQQVANRRAALAAVTGTVDVRARIKMVTSTMKLSNATPQRLSSLVGFSSGTIFLVNLDPPVGVNTSTCLTVTLLARVSLQEFGPFTGFMVFENLPPEGNYTMKVTDCTQVVPFETHHGGSGYLDGNTYLAILSDGKPPSGVTWDPDIIKPGQIYTSMPKAKQGAWKNTDSVVITPTYFCVAELSAGNNVFVGFTDLQQARTFLVAPHSVMSGAVIGVDKTKKWFEAFESTSTTGNLWIYFVTLGSMANLVAGRNFRAPMAPHPGPQGVLSLSSSMTNLSLCSD